MVSPSYYKPSGGLAPQSQLITGRAVFNTAYAVIPGGTNSDIVTSFLPFWTGMRMWVLARPLSGFAETFSQSIVELTPRGRQRAAGNGCQCSGGAFRCIGQHHLEPIWRYACFVSRRLRLYSGRL